MLRAAGRPAVNRVARSSRYLSSSAPLQLAEVRKTSSSTATATVSPPTSPNEPSSSSSPKRLGTGKGTKNLDKQVQKRQLEKLRELITWNWEPRTIREMQTKLENCEHIDEEWLGKQYHIAQTYRIARSRLWVPLRSDSFKQRLQAERKKLSELTAAQTKIQEQLRMAMEGELGKKSDVARIQEKLKHLQDQIRVSSSAEAVLANAQHGDEGEMDAIYKADWIALSDKERSEELMRVRFLCARRVGWRKGYTSGYPQKAAESQGIGETREKLIEQLGSRKAVERRQAVQTLAKEEEEEAWQSWKALDSVTRAEEEQLAWTMRDRSLIYMDDTAKILGVTMSRWYPQPQKVGAMTFLPNVIVRLVRNNVPRNGKYDAFKATFRVPLSMHKHSLRSYLLAIYGLRTTWCRSMIYRAPITRNRFGRKVVGPSRRTFKKVEVGLLEPFVFPEINKSFRQEHLYQAEMMMTRARTYFKMSGKRRWRGKTLLMQKASTVASSNGGSNERPAIMENGGENRRKQVFKQTSVFRNPAMPAASRRRILKLVHQKRLAKEAEVAQKMRQLRLDHQQQQDQQHLQS